MAIPMVCRVGQSCHCAVVAGQPINLFVMDLIRGILSTKRSRLSCHPGRLSRRRALGIVRGS